MDVVQADADRWDARYAGRRTGEPMPPKGYDLVDHAVHGRALDVACGLGEQSIWAAKNGFEVVALDASPVAIERLREAAEQHRVGDRIDARTVDLDDGLPNDVGNFELVICQRFRNRDAYPQLASVTAIGGTLLVTVLSQVGRNDVEIGPFHAPPGELLEAFRDLDVDIVAHIERYGEATLVAHRR